MENGRLLTSAEVAQRFDVSTRTVARWVREGRLPAVRPGGRFLRFREADVEELMSASNQPGQHDQPDQPDDPKEVEQ